MLVFGVWCLAAWFAFSLVFGLVGSGAKLKKDAAEGCLSAILTLVINSLALWVVIAALVTLSS